MKGTHDIVAEPKFVNASTGATADFRLRQGSPAIGSGVPFAAVTTDFTGARRTGGATDRGAYSFGAKTIDASQGHSDAGHGQSSAPAGKSAGESTTGSTPAADASTGGNSDSGLNPNGAGDPLAETGGSDPTIPLAMAAAVLAVGGGLVFAARRKRP
ncbi:choice-of-anchor Q domain-containing protein [Streptomyces sp. NPDC048272]|uniref:choice-of-anchor Q domain-containing protein n=1 Tax=Streptomyces sp. NPDC048272 TaxID=3154616 RepID=UPI0034156698